MQTATASTTHPDRPGLGPKQRKIIRALAEALLSDADDSGHPQSPSEAWLDQVVRDFDFMVGATSPNLRRGYLALTVAIESLPTLVMGSLQRMSQLSLSERIAYLEALEGSRVGLLATLLIAFKIPINIIAYDQGEALTFTGFPRSSLSIPRGKVPIPTPQGALLSRPSEGGRA